MPPTEGGHAGPRLAKNPFDGNCLVLSKDFLGMIIPYRPGCGPRRVISGGL